MGDRYRATVVMDFEASRASDAAKKAESAAKEAARELPDRAASPRDRPTAEVVAVEKAATAERVERVVEITEEPVEADDGE